MKYPKLIGSSVDSEKISLTLKGLVPLILLLAEIYHWKLNADILNDGIRSIIVIVEWIGAGIAALTAFHGYVRRLVNQLRT